VFFPPRGRQSRARVPACLWTSDESTRSETPGTALRTAVRLGRTPGAYQTRYTSRFRFSDAGARTSAKRLPMRLDRVTVVNSSFRARTTGHRMIYAGREPISVTISSTLPFRGRVRILAYGIRTANETGRKQYDLYITPDRTFETNILLFHRPRFFLSTFPKR